MISRSPFTVSASLVTMVVIGFFLVVSFSAILQQIGAPLIYEALLLLVFVLGIYLFSGLFGKTMRFSIFQNADKAVRPLYAGMAIASATISAGIFIVFPGLVYERGTDFLAYFHGIVLGLSLATVLFAAGIARSKETTLSTYLFPQGSKKPFVGLAAVMVLAVSFLFALTQLELLALFAENFFQIPPERSVILIVSVSTLCLLLGGMQALGLARILAYPVLLIAIYVPLVWTTYQITGNPVPQFAFGSGASQAITEIDQEMLNAGLAAQSEIFNVLEDAGSLDGYGYITTLVATALGIAAMPHLLLHHITQRKGREARKTGFWAVVFVLLVLTAIPAIATFAKLNIYTALLGIQLADLEAEIPWIFELSGNGAFPLITLCGSLIASAQNAVSACGQPGDYFISIRDISINSDYLMLSFALVGELPQLLTVIIVTGAVLAVLSTVDGLLLSMANVVTVDFYNRIFRPRSPPGVKLFMNRFFLVLVAALLVWSAQVNPFKPFELFAASLGLATATLFPVLVVRTWITGISDLAITISLAISGLITILLFAAHILGTDFLPGTGDEMKLMLPGFSDETVLMGIGIIGLLIFVLTATANHVIERLRIKNARETADAVT